MISVRVTRDDWTCDRPVFAQECLGLLFSLFIFGIVLGEEMPLVAVDAKVSQPNIELLGDTTSTVGLCEPGNPFACDDCPHAPGCSAPECCAQVCVDFDITCCIDGWTCECADYAIAFCDIGCPTMPPNNNCSGATPIFEGVTPFNTTCATTDGSAHPGCSFAGDDQIYNDLWYRFTASSTGQITMRLCDSNFDTMMAIYAGSNCPPTNLLGCNDDSCSTRSELTVNVVAAQQYYLRIGGFEGATGSGSIEFLGTCPGNTCASAPPIGVGQTQFNSSCATTDGPTDPGCCFAGDCQLNQDIWFNHTATCTGLLTVELCGSSFDTKLAIYESFACSGFATSIIDCNDDACGSGSSITFNSIEGNTYKIRVGGYSDDPSGPGVVGIGCEPMNPCPAGEVVMVSPASGVVDARQPSPPSGTPKQGIGFGNEPIQLLLPSNITNAGIGCFSVCETDTAGQAPNSVIQATSLGNGQYQISLARPITRGAVTTLKYAGAVGHIELISHPANANADNAASPVDILFLIDMLNGVTVPPHGIYSQDIDHSAQFNPADILRLIDLLNGADAFDAWNGTTKPVNSECP